MRLEKIKLAGFKSFVDPTTVPFPSNLVAVVGPNGCGKSNVIDAVRWVMGESSAKMLRGESMADVIFNGSSARKPVGQAVIELMFDNSDGGAGGQYAQYNQISVKRQVSRDGQSNYFLNNTRCRRRDITDLFLGTGLGPRSYSIIEQGTISRLIEARPEELRNFLEEAAGISKYKERRRETENRIRHTRENLDRLNDLREEVGKHLQRLERQAATAERYTRLKEEERRLKAELLALRWRVLDQDLSERESRIGAMETALEAARAEQRRLEAGLEEQRELQHEVGDAFNEVQGRFYAIGAEIARIEQALQYNRDSRKRQEQELHRLEGELQSTQGQMGQDETRQRELETALEENEPALEALSAEEEARVMAQDEAEEQMQAWQHAWDEFNHGAAEPAQTAQVERTRINHLEQQVGNLERRLLKLDEELGRLDNPHLEQELAELEENEQILEEQAAELQERLEAAHGRIQEVRGSQAQVGYRLDDVKSELQSARGRHASLEALQQAALQDDSGELGQWLARQSLDSARRLADHIEVREPWQRAAESVLGQNLQALCVDRLDDHAGALHGLPEGSGLRLYETSKGGTSVSGPDSLAAQVRSPWPLAGLLDGIALAQTLDDALARRASLRPGQSLVTVDGIWLGADWLYKPGSEQAGAGVLERGAELKELDIRIAELEAEAHSLEQSRQRARETLDQSEAERADAQAERDRVTRELGRVRGDLSGKRTRMEHLRQRRESIDAEQAETREQIALDRETSEEARERLHRALEQMETLAERREALVERRDHLRSTLEEARAAAKTASEQARRIALEVQAARTARDSLNAGMERLRLQLAQMHERREKLQEGVEAAEEPLLGLEQELELQLAARIEIEGELAAARDRMESVDAALRGGEQGRLKAEQGVQKQREILDEARLNRQELLIRTKTLDEQLKESGFSRKVLLETIPEDAPESQWVEEVQKIAGRIQRLGAINLAAIDEFKEESQRKDYLDQQHDDISSALGTLEDAIQKIDRETRTRFKDTFDKVNSGLQALFPKLFGGGHAYLELTGEDLLDTGVTVMARPPGKRNSSIHLLSGGEKALTAVAMVFSIFQLNPAPFCMLDEVDAPLDDANVSRFCELVRSMAEHVQFIFITHNKITMELAKQLTGVTMHEPGVSRLVSVDVDEAVRLVAV